MLVRLVDFSGAFPANPLKRNGRHDWTRTSDLYRVKANLFNPFNATYITPEELLFKPCFINHLRKPQFLTALTRASRVPYSLEAGEHPVSRPSGNYLAASTFLLPKHFSGFDTLVKACKAQPFLNLE